jgi:hypothetical protein
VKGRSAMLCNKAARLQHTDQTTAMDCAALADRIGPRPY